MTNETKVVEQRIVQRLIKTIADYEVGGNLYSQVIPLHTQAYAIYDSQEKSGLYYVFGDGVHTYTEIRDGQSSLESSHEYAVFDDAWIALVNSKADLQYMNFELAKRQYISNLVNEITEENEKSTILYPSVKASVDYIKGIADELRNDIDTESETRADADFTLQTNINNEESARILADTTLQDNIDTEATTRETQDNTLATNITNEATARTNADNIITQNLNTEITARENADTVLNTGLASKIDKYAELPETNKNYANKIVQYTGETTEDYVNGYFYKCIENGDKPDSIEFTPKPGVSTIVSVTPEDFVAFITPWCEGRSFGPSDVTHGSIGIYSSSQYSMTIETDDDNFAHGVFTITELEAAGFSFNPKFSAQQGATYVCSIGQKDYAWEQINVQPETDTSALQAQIASLTQQIKDLKLTIPQEVFTADEVRTKTKQSGKVTLCEDVDLGTVSLVDGTFANNITSINLNGYTLSASPTGGRALLQLRGSSQYTFNGNGTVEDFADDSSCVWSRTANNVCTINGGTWIAHGHTETIYCQLGTININGGVFKTDAEDKRYVLNCLDANFKAGTAKIIVKGGEFWDFDPSANPEGPDTSYVAEGYTVTSREEDGHTIYTVVKA